MEKRQHAVPARLAYINKINFDINFINLTIDFVNTSWYTCWQRTRDHRQ